MSKDAKSSNEEQQTKSPRKKFLTMIAVLAVVAGASWMYFGSAEAGAEAKEKPVAGKILKLDAIQLNLAEGRYLRLGIALQGTEEAGDYLEGSKALDAAIELFSGRQMEDLAQPVQREVLKEKLQVELEKRYYGKVMDVYFTDFVMQ